MIIVQQPGCPLLFDTEVDRVEAVCGGISIGSLIIAFRSRCDSEMLGTVLDVVCDVCRLYPDVIVVSSSNSNGIRCYVISAVYRLPGILVYSPGISGIIPDIYCSCRAGIYLSINPGERFGDSDSDRSCIGTAVTIADGVGEAISAAEAGVRGVGDVAVVIDDRAMGPLSDGATVSMSPSGSESLFRTSMVTGVSRACITVVHCHRRVIAR